MLFYVLKKLRGSVRTKILIVVFGALLLPVILVFAEGRFLLNAITPLENEALTTESLRLEGAVEQELTFLLKDNLSQSAWTAFHEYLSAPNDPEMIAFRKTNVDNRVPELHNVQLIVIATPDGKIVYAYGDVPEFGLGRNISTAPIFLETIGRDSVAGYLKTSTGYYAVASATVRPAEDVDQSSPSSGVYLIGRLVDASYVDTAFASRLLSQISLSPDATQVGDQDVSATGTAQLDQGRRNWNAEEMTIDVPLPRVLFGAPAPTLRITESRSLYRIAQAQLFQSAIAVSIIVLLALVITFYIFEHVVFRPLFGFLKQVEESGRAGRLSSVIEIKTGDEFEHLTKTYNSMVGAVGHAEEQLLVSQKFLRTVLETVLLPIVVVDKDSDRVTMVNPAGRSLLVDTVGSRAWTDFQMFLKAAQTSDGSAYPSAKNPYTIAKGKNRVAQVDDVMLTVHGKPAFYSMTAQPLQLTKSDRPQVLVALFDISKQREVEKLRTEFADIVAHQLRTPLTALKWAVEATEGATAKERDGYLKEIGDTVERTLTLINQLLNIARLAAGRTKFAMQPVALRDIAEAVIVEMRPTIDRHKIAVAMDIPSGLRPFADTNGLREVLANLLSNAVKYSPEGGAVRISAHPEADAVVIAVADSGIGIPATEQDKIFEKFFRASNVAGDEGSGLGLATVKDFVEAMGGSVRFESVQGKGSTFFVRIKTNGKVA